LIIHKTSLRLMWGPNQNLGPIVSAFLTLLDTNKQTAKQRIYIYIDVNYDRQTARKFIYSISIVNIFSLYTLLKKQTKKVRGFKKKIRGFLQFNENRILLEPNFLILIIYKPLLWGHFSRFGVYWIQADKQTRKVVKTRLTGRFAHIFYYNSLSLFVYIVKQKQKVRGFYWKISWIFTIWWKSSFVGG